MLELELPLFFFLADFLELLFVALNLLLDRLELGLPVDVGLMEFPDLGRRGLSLSNRHGDPIVQFLEPNQQSEIVAYVVHRFPLLHLLDIPRRNQIDEPWAHQDSNLGPTGYEPAALTAELWAQRILAPTGSKNKRER